MDEKCSCSSSVCVLVCICVCVFAPAIMGFLKKKCKIIIFSSLLLFDFTAVLKDNLACARPGDGHYFDVRVVVAGLCYLHLHSLVDLYCRTCERLT